LDTEKAGPKHTENWGIPLIQKLIKPLMYLKVLREANERIFREYIRPRRPEEEVMEKYGVEIDPAKVEKEKVGSKGVQPKADPNTNIPLDDEKGSEPFERDPEEKPDGKKGP
jgi:hypothetical protein